MLLEDYKEDGDEFVAVPGSSMDWQLSIPETPLCTSGTPPGSPTARFYLNDDHATIRDVLVRVLC